MKRNSANTFEKNVCLWGKAHFIVIAVLTSDITSECTEVANIPPDNSKENDSTATSLDQMTSNCI